MLKPCQVTIYSLELKEFNPPYFKIECFVSGGTYIRSLIVDIARSLNSYVFFFFLIILLFNYLIFIFVDVLMLNL